MKRKQRSLKVVTRVETRIKIARVRKVIRGETVIMMTPKKITMVTVKMGMSTMKKIPRRSEKARRRKRRKENHAHQDVANAMVVKGRTVAPVKPARTSQSLEGEG